MKYVEGIGRNTGEENQRSHLYEDREDGYYGLCIYSYNRSDGADFSIFRGHRGKRGLCKICEKRRESGLPGIEGREGSHKTKWL